MPEASGHWPHRPRLLHLHPGAGDLRLRLRQIEGPAYTRIELALRIANPFLLREQGLLQTSIRASVRRT